MSGMTHLFNLNIDYLFKSGTSRCGKRLSRKNFALGSEEATCPECRRLVDEQLAGDRLIIDQFKDRPAQAALCKSIADNLAVFEPNKYRNHMFVPGYSS